MATGVAGILNHAMTAAQATTKSLAAPAESSTTSTSGTSGSDDSSGDSATISANDFLTLLVTEMQNQDPTADTDPNEYIDQLVQVNSLEQLIDINQTLSTALGTTAATKSGSSTEPQTANASGTVTNSPATATTARHNVGAGTVAQIGNAASGTVPGRSAVNRAPGNLSVPGVNRAAQRVGHALGGRTRAQPAVAGGAAAQM